MADAPYPLDCLNLDAMDPTDLQVIAVELRRLAHYADMKIVAMRLRLNGRTTDALATEAKCENIYKAIPDNWRW